MAQVQRRRGRIQLRLNAREREALGEIIDRLAPRVGATLATTPRAYDDAGHQAEYDRWVRPDVDRSREADLGMVRDGLAAGEDVLPLTEAQALAWLRALNQLRLAAGDILGIEADGWEERTDPHTRQQPEFGVLIALGWIQEELVAALES